MKKLVIKIVLLYLVLYANCYAQNIEDNYLLINKVIELTRDSKTDKPYSLLEFSSPISERLNKYYNFRFKNRPFYTVIELDENDSIIKENEEVLKKRQSFWSEKCKTMDSIFSKKDIQNMQSKDKKAYWDTSKIKHNINLIHGEKVYNCYSCNSISDIYYSLDYRHAIIQHSNAKNTSWFIFKKQNLDWVLIDRIEGLWF